MACSLDATAGGASANTYCSSADADTYHLSHLYSDTWDGASADEKCRALVMATRLLDVWFEWKGVTSTDTQALLWPRSAAYGPAGFLEDNTAIPTLIRDATAELARQLLDADRTKDNDTETQGLTSLTAGPVSMGFGAVVAKPIPDAVMAMVNVYGTVKSRTGASVTLRRA